MCRIPSKSFPVHSSLINILFDTIHCVAYNLAVSSPLSSLFMLQNLQSWKSHYSTNTSPYSDWNGSDVYAMNPNVAGIIINLSWVSVLFFLQAKWRFVWTYAAKDSFPCTRILCSSTTSFIRRIHEGNTKAVTKQLTERK